MNRRRKDANKLFWNAFLGLSIALVILYGINIFLTGGFIESIKASAEDQRPANLHLTLIANDCENCYDMNELVSFIKSQNVKIIQEKNLLFTDKDAQKIMSENNIKSLPALIITGETFQSNIAPLWQNLGVEPVDDVIVLSDIPPYYSLDEKIVVGLVEVIRLTDNSCVECYDVETHMQVLPRFGIYIDRSLTYDISSDNGKKLVEKYNITKVPTTILSPDVSIYNSLVQIWNQVGTVESDGWYVFRATDQMGTYKDLSQNKVINSAG